MRHCAGHGFYLLLFFSQRTRKITLEDDFEVR